MGDMANTRQCFTTKSISTNGCQVFESFELGGGETFTKNGKIFFLENSQNMKLNGSWRDLR
jgi:hypothetical protein